MMKIKKKQIKQKKRSVADNTEEDPFADDTEEDPLGMTQKTLWRRQQNQTPKQANINLTLCPALRSALSNCGLENAHYTEVQSRLTSVRSYRMIEVIYHTFLPTSKHLLVLLTLPGNFRKYKTRAYSSSHTTESKNTSSKRFQNSTYFGFSLAIKLYHPKIPSHSLSTWDCL